jgi:hypothetical protein
MTKQIAKELKYLNSKLEYLHAIKDNKLVEADNYYLVREIEDTSKAIDYLEPHRNLGEYND